MSNQREHSLGDLLNEVRGLKERMKAILPSYTASLKELAQLPEEFERRFWASRVDALLEKAKADYEKYQAQAQKAGLYGRLMTVAADIVLKAGGMESIPFAHIAPWLREDLGSPSIRTGTPFMVRTLIGQQA